MSNRAVGLVWERSRAKGSNLLVLLAIADLADDEGRDFWQSNQRLRDKSRMSERSLHYILAKLRRDKEILIRRNVEKTLPKKSKGYIPERYIDVQCVSDWPTYRNEGAAKFAGGDDFDRMQSLQSSTAESGSDDYQKLQSYKRKDLLVDLSVDLKAATLARRETQTPAEPASYWQLAKLVHVALDEAAFSSYSDLSDDVKTRAAQAKLLYDPEVLTRAVYSVLTTRGYERRGAARSTR